MSAPAPATTQDPSRPISSSFHGKVAIVTGAGSHASGIGNGRATSILLAEQGCTVICVDLNLAWAEHTVSMITSESNSSNESSSSQLRRRHGMGFAVQADVTKAEDCERVVNTALEKFGRLDVLVNIVGIGGAKGTAVDVDMMEWALGMEINVASMVLMSKYAIPAMLRNDLPNRGCIINMGSVAGLKGGTPTLLYLTSKGAIVNMTRAMAAHHAREGIRVNCVCPGMLYTPMVSAGGMTEEAREARRERSLLGTEGSAWDAGCAIRFLASGEARWITGVVLPVDAGTTAAVGTELPKSASVGGHSAAKE